MKTMEDFSLLVARDSVVAAFFGAWRMGQYPTFEQMLINLVIALAEDRKILIDNAVRAVMERREFLVEKMA